MTKRQVSYSLAAAVSFTTFVLYLPAIQNGFVLWDDDQFIYQNIYIRAINPAFLKWAVSDFTTFGNWMPLTWISFAIDYALWGLNPAGYHLTGILLHSANSFLVVLFSKSILDADDTLWNRRLFLGQREQHIIYTAALTGLLFGIHPIHVEPAVWAADRRDLLCGIFFLLSLLYYGRHAAYCHNAAIPSRKLFYFRRTDYLMTLLCYLLALSSKSMAITLPLLFILMDWYPFRRIRSSKDLLSVISEKIPFVSIGLFVGVIAYFGQKAAGAFAFGTSVPLTERILVAPRSVVLYLVKMVYPVGLLPFYPYPDKVSPGHYEFWAPVLIIFLVMSAALLAVKKRPWLMFLCGFYILTLIPVMGIIQIGEHAMADRYVYLSSISVCLFAGMAVAWVWGRAGDIGTGGIWGKSVLIAGVFLVCAFLARATFSQIRIWKDSIELWSTVIHHEPSRVPGAYHNRAMAYEKAGKTEQALADYTTAISLKPQSSYTYMHRGMLLQKLGQFGPAMEDFNTAISLDPGAADTYIARGRAFKNNGQIERAIEDFNRGIKIAPEGYAAFNDRGMAYQVLGRPDVALGDFTKAVSLNPFCTEAYVNRGIAYEQLGQRERAMEDYTSAIRADSSFANAYNNRGLLFQRKGLLKEALGDLNTAIMLNPSGFEAFNNRGLVNEDLGELEHALADYSRAVELKPDDYLAYMNRGVVFSKMGNSVRALSDYRMACDLGGEAGCAAAGNAATP